MAEQQKYRVSFEVVNPISRPQAYSGERPRMRASEIPELWWSRVERESYELEDVKSQYDGLVEMEAQGELVRNARLEKATVTWEAL